MCNGVDDSWGHDSWGALLPRQSPPSVTKLSPQSTLIALTVTTIHSPQFTLITQMTVGEMTVRLMKVDVGDSEGGDCWGSREVEINTIIR